MGSFIKLSRYMISSLEDLLPNLKQMIKKQNPEITDEDAEFVIRHLWDVIPQGNKNILAPWLIKIWLNNNGYVDENRVRFLINTIYEAKKTFPNNFPSTFNINDYGSLSELEDFLDPWITKLDNLQKKHINKEQSKELGQIVYQKGEYKILRIDKPEDIVKFLEMNDLHCWCIHDLSYARRYGTSWFLYRRNDIIGVYTRGEKKLRDRNDKIMRDPEAVNIFVEFLKQEGREDEADNLIAYMNINQDDLIKYMIKELTHDLLSLDKDTLDKLIIKPLLEIWDKNYRDMGFWDLPPVPTLYDICDIMEYIRDPEDFIYTFADYKEISEDDLEDIIEKEKVEDIHLEIVNTFLDIIQGLLDKKMDDISKSYQEAFIEIVKDNGYDDVEEAPDDLKQDIDILLSEQYRDDDRVLFFTEEEVATIRNKFKKLMKEKYGIT
ncbi:MAG TPA: hypothetical protein P5513_07590 [Candidatus Diapherotrites archaeon]|nr:hypothetical protein [Candidatus Diapherotrites archaeon]